MRMFPQQVPQPNYEQICRILFVALHAARFHLSQGQEDQAAAVLDQAMERCRKLATGREPPTHIYIKRDN